MAELENAEIHNEITKPNGRRAVQAVVSLVLGGILIAGASIGISIVLDKQAREQSECRADARNMEFAGVRTEIAATTVLIELALKPGELTPAEIEAGAAQYHQQLTIANRHYADAKAKAATC